MKEREKKMKTFREFWRRLCRKKMTVVCLILFAAIVTMAVLAPFISPYGYDDQDYSIRQEPPSWEHLFGTDQYGRDIFTRVLYGGRVSLSIGIVVAVLVTALGGLLGCIVAYFGGKIDFVTMRVLDVMMAIPPMLLALVISATLGTGIINTILALIISGIPIKTHQVRGPALALRNQEYIEAAIALNTPTIKIIIKHIIPNIMAQLLVIMTLSISSNIVQVSSLSFLGLGIQPPTPEWGAMLASGRSLLRDAPWIILAPGIVMMITLFSLNIIGDGIRDALDPKLKD